MQEYVDFEIRINAIDDTHWSIVIHSPGGDIGGEQQVVTNPTTIPNYGALATRLAQFDTDEDTLISLGLLLFNTLFQGQCREVYARTQGMLTSNQGMRLRLVIAPSATSIAAVPWEFLADPDQGPLALLDAPIVRYLPHATRIPVLEAPLPLKILLTAAQTLPAVNVEHELRLVEEVLRTLGKHVQITVEPHLTRTKLQRYLRETFHIWHFVGHGGYDRDSISGRLYFEDNQGDAEPVSAMELGILLNRSGVRLIILDACEGARLATDPFRSLAPALVRAQVPAIVAMQFPVPKETTRAFAVEFYRALTEGFPIDACVTEGRKAVMSVSGLRNPDWGIPVVYTRAPDARIFQPLPPEPPIVQRTVPSDICPYRGLETFQEQDGAFFFGRTELVQTLIAKIRHAPFLAVLGPSGSGKSSLIRAGLIRALQSGALAGSDRWRYAIFKPGSRPLDALATTLAGLSGSDLASSLTLSKMLADDPRSVVRAADLLLASRPEARLVLVVDQAEELWTRTPMAPEASALFAEEQQYPFIERLLAAATVSASHVLIILIIRADFVHRAAEHVELAKCISDNNFIVSPMMDAELRDAIIRPAEAVGCRFEPGLVDQLVIEVQGQPGALPLLEYSLLELWKARLPDGTMTWKAFRGMGGVEGALAARADTIIAEFYSTLEQQEALRRILVRLVQPGEETADTRRRVMLVDLVSIGDSLETVQSLLNPLISERLITAGRDDATGLETVELSHEALIHAWPTFTAWIGSARKDLRLQLQIEEAARAWEHSGKTAEFLWSGQRLADAQAWVTRAEPDLSVRTQYFLRVSQSYVQELTARDQEARAFRALASAQKLIGLARSLANDQPLLSLRLALEGLIRAPANDPGVRESLLQDVRTLAASGRLMKLGGEIQGIGASPDHSILIINTTNSGELRSASDGALLQSLAEPVSDISFSLNTAASLFVVGYSNNPAELRRTSDGSLLKTLSGRLKYSDFGNGAKRPDQKDRVMFSPSPSGTVFVIEYWDHPAELRRVSDGAILHTFHPRTESYNNQFSFLNLSLGKALVMFSPNPAATNFVVTYENRPGELRRLADGTLLQMLDKPVADVIFCSAPTASAFIIIYDDFSGELRSSVDANICHKLQEPPIRVIFSPDANGSHFIVEYENISAELRRTTDNTLLQSISRRSTSVMDVTTSFDSGSEYNFSNSQSRVSSQVIFLNTRLERTYPLRQLQGSQQTQLLALEVDRFAFSPDSAVTFYIVQHEDGSSELRRTVDGTLLQSLPGKITNIHFSPNLTSSVFIITYVSHHVELRRTRDGALLKTLRAMQPTITFSPDRASSRVFLSYNDCTELRSASDGELLKTIAGAVRHIRFSSDTEDSVMFIIYNDRPAEIRRTVDGSLLQRLTGLVQEVVFTPEVSTPYVAVIYESQTGELWSLSGTPSRIKDLGEGIDQVMFVPRSQRLVVSYNNGAAYIHDIPWMLAVDNSIHEENLIRLLCVKHRAGSIRDEDLALYLDGEEPMACD